MILFSPVLMYQPHYVLMFNQNMGNEMVVYRQVGINLFNAWETHKAYISQSLGLAVC